MHYFQLIVVKNSIRVFLQQQHLLIFKYQTENTNNKNSIKIYKISKPVYYGKNAK